MQGGDLRKALWLDAKIGTQIFDWDNKGKHVALAVARGLHFLHKNDVIHRFGRDQLTSAGILKISSEPGCRSDLQLHDTSVVRRR